MLSGSWARYAPLSGVLFVVLLVGSIVVSGSTPDSNDSTAKVVQVWSDNDSKQITSAILSALAMVPFIWFLGSLRSAFRVAEGGTGRLSSIVFGGGLVLVAFSLVDSSIQFATAESVNGVPPLVTQSLSVLYTDFFLGFPVGVGTFALASGLVVLRTRVLAAWLGWVILVLGIVSFAPAVGFFASFPVFLWVLIVSVILFRQGETAVPPAAPAPATA